MLRMVQKILLGKYRQICIANAQEANNKIFPYLVFSLKEQGLISSGGELQRCL